MVDHIVDASAPRGRVEIRSGVGRRRRWSDAEKGRIVAEFFTPGAVVSEVARRHEISPQHLFAWRKAARAGQLALPADHRALPAARELGRGGADRDVSGRGLGAAGRGHHGGLWGTRVSPSTVSELNKKIYGNDRGLAQSADRGRAPLRLSGRHRAQAQLGRRGAQRVAAGGDRRERRGLSGDSRHLRGRQGGQGGLERVPQAPQGARPRAASG